MRFHAQYIVNPTKRKKTKKTKKKKKKKEGKRNPPLSSSDSKQPNQICHFA